MPIIAGVRLL